MGSRLWIVDEANRIRHKALEPARLQLGFGPVWDQIAIEIGHLVDAFNRELPDLPAEQIQSKGAQTQVVLTRCVTTVTATADFRGVRIDVERKGRHESSDVASFGVDCDGAVHIVGGTPAGVAEAILRSLLAS